ncbi:MAG: hypothetical protein WCP36_07650 [Methanomicrobiales archaeon]
MYGICIVVALLAVCSAPVTAGDETTEVTVIPTETPVVQRG